MIHKRTLWLGLLLLLWGATIVEGFKILEDYTATPGFVPTIRHAWPVNTALPPPPSNQANVILFIVSNCSCSRKVLNQLQLFLEQTSSIAKTVQVVFVKSPDSHQKIQETELWKRAQALTGVSPLIDDGTEAHRFDALLSGHLFIYDERGQLAFSGGITNCREADANDEALRTAIHTLVDKESLANRTRVFGCAFANNDPMGREVK